MQRILGSNWGAKRTGECGVTHPPKKKVLGKQEWQQFQMTLRNPNMAFGGDRLMTQRKSFMRLAGVGARMKRVEVCQNRTRME